jgi:hypothetical protein
MDQIHENNNMVIDTDDYILVIKNDKMMRHLREEHAHDKKWCVIAMRNKKKTPQSMQSPTLEEKSGRIRDIVYTLFGGDSKKKVFNVVSTHLYLCFL